MIRGVFQKRCDMPTCEVLGGERDSDISARSPEIGWLVVQGVAKLAAAHYCPKCSDALRSAINRADA